MSDPITHPSQDELSAFNLGHLPPESALKVEDHVSECDSCCETLMGLASHDTFVALLKEAKQPGDESHAPTLVTGTDTRTASQDTTIPIALTEHTRYEVARLIGKGGMPAAFGPSILPVVCEITPDFRMINSPETKKQLEAILKQPHSPLPATEAAAQTEFQFKQEAIDAFDRGADFHQRAPFDALRWEASDMQARVRGTWYQLQEIDGVPVENIVAFCRRVDEQVWLKRFAEDLVQVLNLMEHPPGDTVDLKVKDGETGKTILLKAVPMTEENRRELRKEGNTSQNHALELEGK